MKRYGMIIKLRADKVTEYKALHANAWPEVLSMISACHIKNYTIYLREPENFLFSSFEYHGSNFAADMEKMAADPKTKEWWALTDPCQEKLDSCEYGEWWAPMEEVFHHD